MQKERYQKALFESNGIQGKSITDSDFVDYITGKGEPNLLRSYIDDAFDNLPEHLAPSISLLLLGSNLAPINPALATALTLDEYWQLSSSPIDYDKAREVKYVMLVKRSDGELRVLNIYKRGLFDSLRSILK